MRVLFLKAWREFKEGETTWMPSHLAYDLIEKGIVKEVCIEPIPEHH